MAQIGRIGVISHEEMKRWAREAKREAQASIGEDDKTRKK
jgi:hypothetical protein